MQNLLKETYRLGKLNLKNGYHEAPWVESKKGHMARLAIPESTV